MKTISRNKIQRMVGRGTGGGGGGGRGVDLAGYATQGWVEQNYVSKAFFSRLFTALDADGEAVEPNDEDTAISNIQAMFGFWTEKYISALGKGDDGGGSVISGYLSQLLDVNVTSPQVGQALVYNGTKWVNQTIQTGGIDFNDMKLLTVKVGTNTTVIEYKGETAKTLTFDAVANSGITVSGDTGGTITIGYTLPTASANTLGGVKVGNTLSISDGVLNLPIISNLVAGTYRSVTVDAYGRVTAGTNPTTLEGYGITDAVSNSTKWWGQSIQTVNNAKVVKGDMTDVGNITMTGCINMPRLGDGIKFLVGSSYIPALRMFQNSDIVALGYETFQRGFGTNIYGNEVYIQHGIYDGTNYFTSFRSNGHVTINAQDDTDASRNIFLNVGGSTKTSRLYLSNDIYLVVENGGVHVVGGGLYADTFVSALGKGDDGGGSVISGYLSQLLDVNVTSPQVGQALVYNGMKWVNQIIQTGGIDFNDMKFLTVKVGANTKVVEYKGETAKTLTFDAVANSGITVSGDTGGTITIGYTLPTASANTLGGVKVGNTLSISDGVLNLPTINNLVAGTYRSVTVDAYGRVTAGTNPTTLEGYGITDAVSNSTKWWGQSIQTVNNAKVVKGDMTDVGNITMTGSINMPRLGDGIKFLVDSSYIPALRMFQNSDIVALGYETFQRGFGTNIYGNEVYIQHGIYDGANYFTSFRNNGHVTINAQDDTDASRNIFLNVGGSTKTSRLYLSNDIYLVVENGGVHVVGGGLYADTFVSALGKGDDGGTSTFDESQMWTALGGSISNKQIASSHLSTALASYATQQWVTNQLGNISNYVTTNTNQTITGQKTFNGSYMQPLVVDSSNANDNRTAIQFKHTVNGTSVFYGGISMSSEGGSFQRYDQNYTRYTIWDSGNDGSGSGLDADLLDGKHASEFALASSLSNYLPLSGGAITSSLHQSLILRTTTSDANSWIGLSFRTFLNSTETLIGGIRMDSQDSYLKRYDSAYNVYTILDSGNSSVTLSGETLTVKINGTSKSLTNTWRGIQDNLTSTSTTDSLSANQGRLLKNDVTTLQGYFSNGVAKSAAKLSDTAAYTAWGRTFFTNGKPATVSGALESVTNITMSGDIKMQQGHYITAYIDDAYYNVLGAWGGSLKVIQLGYNTSLSKQYATNIYGNTLRLYGSSTSLGILINTSGNVGIGTSSPSAKLDVQGSVKIGGATLTWDSDKQALKIDKGFYSDLFVSALGANASGGSGSGIDANWLKTNDVQIQRLGIGVAPSSSYRLNVQDASNFNGPVSVNSSVTAIGGISTSQGSISAAHNITAGGNGLIHGKLTVGQTSESTSNYKLYIGGGGTSKSIYAEGDIYTHGSEVDYSDVRLKNIVEYVNNLSVDMVAKAPIFKYYWKDRINDRLRIGTSAQYWQEVLPQAVEVCSDGYLGMSYAIAALASSVSVARKVVDHELRVKQLEERIAELENEINELKAA